MTEADELRAEIARLRAGEADEPAPEDTGTLTPAQWIRRWNDVSAERRLAWAESIAMVAEQASQCFRMHHNGLAEETERLRADNVRMRLLLTRILDIPRKPAVSEQEGQLGRAYTRGWESVIQAIGAALFAGDTHV
ncbi:hypothetical protein AB0395_39640 [Streptosporangium sp. NPDC051023]|uniref:hypothetical protein n=1 Tax=Streptosporangium sp. NPDC051023 TaxID=3155410 RepID=UPI00344DF58D